MLSNEHLKRLFRAYRDGDDLMFHKVADSIIAEETVANHLALANDLRKALGARPGLEKQSNLSLTALPKNRRRDVDLIQFPTTHPSPQRLVLNGDTREQIDRVILEHRRRFDLAACGYRPKSTLLFWGPPGCGKTFTANYIAVELGLPLAVLRLSTVISSFVGETAYHIQEVLNRAQESPMVLLLDEFDAIGKNREDRNDVGELKRVVNGVLQSLDEFRSTDSIVIAASNHQHLLDSALWRRFDDIIHFPFPSIIDRIQYLKTLLNGVMFEGSFELIAQHLKSVSFADIERAVQEATKTMVLEGRKGLDAELIEYEYELRRQAISQAARTMVNSDE